METLEAIWLLCVWLQKATKSLGTADVNLIITYIIYDMHDGDTVQTHYRGK